MAIQYTKRILVQRIRKHVADGYPNDDFSASTNEIMLYIDQALAFGLIGQVYQNAKVEGNLVMPEAYMTTFLLPALQKDSLTEDWYSTLPQTPVNLPLGYSISDVYFATMADGKSESVLPIRNKRVAFRNFMPKPYGTSYRVEANKIFIKSSNNYPLLGLNLYVTMAKTRTTDLDEIMALPDDAIEAIFNNVVTKLTQRGQEPKDIIKDQLPSGNKAS